MKNAKRTRKATSEFYKLRRRLFLSVEDAADICGVTRRTIQNWDEKGAPLSAMRLLPFWDHYHVPFRGWEGFCFSRDVLLYRGRERFTPEYLIGDRERTERLMRLEIERNLRARHPFRYWLSDGCAILKLWLGQIRRYVRPIRIELKPLQDHEQS
jgi:DNA-binding XRE family transcriptional regulator